MQREALTIRFPADLLVKAKKIKQGSESLNDLVVKSVNSQQLSVITVTVKGFNPLTVTHHLLEVGDSDSQFIN